MYCEYMFEVSGSSGTEKILQAFNCSLTTFRASKTHVSDTFYYVIVCYFFDLFNHELNILKIGR